MIEWNEQQQQIRKMIRRFVETEIAPKLDEYEFGDTPPYDVLRKFAKTFGLADMAKAQFKAQIAKDKALAAGDKVDDEKKIAPPPPARDGRPISGLSPVAVLFFLSAKGTGLAPVPRYRPRGSSLIRGRTVSNDPLVRTASAPFEARHISCVPGQPGVWRATPAGRMTHHYLCVEVPVRHLKEARRH